MNSLSSPAACLHVSNLLTYLSLMAAVAAVASAMHGPTGWAGACIAVSVLADTFDGRFARLFARDEDRRAFGAQLDSLSDVAAFGLAPAICLALLSPPPGLAMEFGWWGAAFLYAGCAVTRLGFYNLATSDGFIGLPVPVAALILSSALLAGPPPVLSLVLLVLTAGAMIAPVRLPRPTGVGLATFVLWPVLLLVWSFAR